MINITYSEVEQIIYLKRDGEVTFPDILELLDKIDYTFRELDVLHIITEISSENPKYEPEDFEEFILDIKKRISNFKGVKEAVVTTTPNSTAFAILFKSLSNKIPNYQSEIFATQELAKAWLKSEI